MLDLTSSAQLTCLPPFIAMTGNASSHDRQQYASAGFIDTLAKPFSMEDLGKSLAAVAARLRQPVPS